MKPGRILLLTALIAGITLVYSAAVDLACADEADPAEVEFFEKRIRPVLVEKCYRCHSADAKTPKGGLLLDHREGLLVGGDSGPAVVPGNLDESLLIEAIRYGDGASAMPPDAKLPDDVIADFSRWVETGAADPRSGNASPPKTQIDLEAGRKFWAFQPPQKSDIPEFADDWPRSEIDAFIFARLKDKGLKPVADAGRVTLIRRAYFDLVGLPPSPEAVDEFVADPSPLAFENLVDGLLASDRFGERWGRHWLDVARFAESTGRAVNFPLNFAWRYRNYVIDALNEDKPFDVFIREQIAGDLLPAEDAAQSNEQKIATGFLVVGPRALDYDDREDVETQKYFLSDADEQIDVTCRGFLALTVACARCHDHKFDPIPTADYYALAGIFRSSVPLVGYVHGLGNSGRYYPKHLAVLDGYDEKDYQQFAAYVAEATSAWDTLKEQMTELWTIRREEGQPGFTNAMRESQETVVKDLRGKLDALAKKLPAAAPVAMGVADAPEPVDLHVCIAGDPANEGPHAPRGVLQVIDTTAPVVIPADRSGRHELADWIASEQNPLTARVMVNRIWHHLIGRGLVATVDNFGATGESPSHPELLDNLAMEFMEQGWSVKSMIRRIMLSRTYQLASDHDAANYEADPDNIFLWRMSRRRLEIEPLRDAMLAVSGQLNLNRPSGSPLAKIGGVEITADGKVPMEARLARGNHRTVYQTLVRDFEPEMLRVFDFPSTSSVHGSRDATTVATQALFLMNNPFVLEQSRHAAGRVLAAPDLDMDGRVELAYRLALGRKPSSVETTAVLDYLAEVGQPVDLLDESEQQPAEESDLRLGAWAGLFQTLFASAEFRYLE